MEFDEEILKDFLIEVKEGIERLEDGFIRLERGEREVLKELFRVMHSLKGAAGFFGFKALEQVAHASEDILARLRDGLIEPTDEIIDMLLKAVDYIKRIVKHIEDKKKEPIDDELLDFLIELTTFSDKIVKKEETKGETKKELLEEVEKKKKLKKEKRYNFISS